MRLTARFAYALLAAIALAVLLYGTVSGFAPYDPQSILVPAGLYLAVCSLMVIGIWRGMTKWVRIESATFLLCMAPSLILLVPSFYFLAGIFGWQGVLIAVLQAAFDSVCNMLDKPRRDDASD